MLDYDQDRIAVDKIKRGDDDFDQLICIDNNEEAVVHVLLIKDVGERRSACVRSRDGAG